MSINLHSIFYILIIIIMAFANIEKNSIVTPIEKILEFKKWEFSCWNKETLQNDIHILDNFIILDVVYTVKWAVWNDSLNKYTSKFFSNEIRSFSEKLYLLKLDFNQWEMVKELIVKWNWKQNIKPVLPEWASLNMWLVIYDLNDKMIKEVFLSWNNFFKVSTFIKWINPADILNFTSSTKYTNWSKDATNSEILVDETFVDGLKWTEAAKYKKRYVLDISNTWVKYEDATSIKDMADLLDELYIERKKYYLKAYDNVDEIEEEKKPQYFQPTEKENNKINLKEKKIINDDEISIEDLPF